MNGLDVLRILETINVSANFMLEGLVKEEEVEMTSPFFSSSSSSSSWLKIPWDSKDLSLELELFASVKMDFERFKINPDLKWVYCYKKKIIKIF